MYPVASEHKSLTRDAIDSICMSAECMYCIYEECVRYLDEFGAFPHMCPFTCYGYASFRAVHIEARRSVLSALIFPDGFCFTGSGH